MSQCLAAKVSQCLESNEIDGEVLGTFSTLEDMCTHAGLPLVSDLSTLFTDLPTVCASSWGQVLADAFASRRLFARTTGRAKVACSFEQVQLRLQTMILERLEQMVLCQRYEKICQVEALIACKNVVGFVRLDGSDLSLLTPTEALCLIPPGLRQGRQDIEFQLVCLLLQISNSASCTATPPPPQLPPSIPLATIVVLGNTGAGKSTLLNGFLGYVCIYTLVEKLDDQGRERRYHRHLCSSEHHECVCVCVCVCVGVCVWVWVWVCGVCVARWSCFQRMQ